MKLDKKFFCGWIARLMYWFRHELIIALIVLVPLSIYYGVNRAIYEYNQRQSQIEFARYNEIAKITTASMPNVCRDSDSAVIVVGFIPPERQDSFYVAEIHLKGDEKQDNQFYVEAKHSFLSLDRESRPVHRYAMGEVSTNFSRNFTEYTSEYSSLEFNRIRDSVNAVFSVLDCSVDQSKRIDLTYSKYNRNSSLSLMRDARGIWERGELDDSNFSKVRDDYAEELGEYLEWEDGPMELLNLVSVGLLMIVLYHIYVIAFFAPIIYPCIARHKMEMAIVCLSLAGIMYTLLIVSAYNDDSEFYLFGVYFSALSATPILWLICHILWKIDTWSYNPKQKQDNA